MSDRIYSPGEHVLVGKRGFTTGTVVRDMGRGSVKVTVRGKTVLVARDEIEPLSARPVVRGSVHRTPIYEPRPAAQQPKPETYRDAVYLDFVRSHPCVSCGTRENVEAAHFGGKGASGGTGLKASDAYVVPLCHSHHREQHQTGHVPGLEIADVYRAQRDLLAAYVERLRAKKGRAA